MTALNPKLRAAHIVRLTTGIQLIGPDFERFGQLFMDELLGIPLTHAGLNALGFPVGGVVDTQSSDGAWVAEYSAEKGYFNGKMAKATKDLKHALKEGPKARKIVLLSAQLKVKSQAKAFIKAAKAGKGMSRKSIELWGAEEIATRIVDQLLTSDRAVARLNPYLPVLSAVRDEQASSLQMERPPTGALPRDAVNDALTTALAGSACVAISGHGGAGKSVAAAAFADRHRGRYHNLIWLKGRDVPTLESLSAVAIARAGDSRNVAYLLGSRPTLLVIDDDVSGLDRVRLAALCDKGSHIIVTTRSGGGYQIPPFTEDEARLVVGRNTTTPCPDSIFALIWATVGGHPLTYGLINGVVLSGATWEDVQADCEAIGGLDDEDGRPGGLADRLLARVLDVMGRELAFFHWLDKGDCDEGFARAALKPAGLRKLRDACLTTPDRTTVVRLHDVVRASLATVAERLPVLDDEWLDQLEAYIADVATSGDGVPFWTVSKNLDARLRAAIAGGDRRPAFTYALLEVTAPTALDPTLLEDPAAMADRLLQDTATAVRPIVTMAIIETIEAGYLHRKTTVDKATAEAALTAHLPVFDRMSNHPGLTEQQKSEISHHKAKALLRLNRKPEAIALFDTVLSSPHPLHEARLQLVKLVRDDQTRAADVRAMTLTLLEGYGGLGAVSTSVFLATIESLPWKDEPWRGEMIKVYETVIENGLVRATNLGIDQGYRALASIGRYWARHDPAGLDHERLADLRLSLAQSDLPDRRFPWRPGRVFQGALEGLRHRPLSTLEPLAQLSNGRAFALAHHATRASRRGFGLDAPITQGRCEGLAPELEVRLARIEPFPVTSKRPDGEMDVGMPIIRMQGEDIGMSIAEQGVRERARGIVHPAGFHPRRHAQNDRQRDRSILSGRQQIQFCAPVLGQRANLRTSRQTLAVGSLQDESSVSGDVVQVALQMVAVPRSAGDLDHHLRGAARDALKPGGRRLASLPSRYAQHRVRQPRPPHADGRTQRLLEP